MSVFVIRAKFKHLIRKIMASIKVTIDFQLDYTYSVVLHSFSLTQNLVVFNGWKEQAAIIFMTMQRILLFFFLLNIKDWFILKCNTFSKKIKMFYPSLFQCNGNNTFFNFGFLPGDILIDVRKEKHVKMSSLISKAND